MVVVWGNGGADGEDGGDDGIDCHSNSADGSGMVVVMVR
jgi:hypothetical protein